MWHRPEVAVLDARERVAELYRTYGPAIYRRCVRLLGDREAARDATQEVFGKLMRDAIKLEGRGKLEPEVLTGDQVKNPRNRRVRIVIYRPGD